MTLTTVQQNVLSKIQGISAELLDIKNDLQSLVLMYTSEGIGTITDEDLQSLSEFEHVTAEELQAAGAALASVNTNLGDYTAGSNVAKLLRVVINVP